MLYTPAADYFGPDSFTYKVCDNGQSGSPLADDFKCSTAVATITVTPVNDAPVATADAKTTAEDTAANVLRPGQRHDRPSQRVGPDPEHRLDHGRRPHGTRR